MDNRVRIRRGIYEGLVNAEVQDIGEFTNMLLYLWLEGKVHIGEAAPPPVPHPTLTAPVQQRAVHHDTTNEAVAALNSLLEDDW